MARRASRVVEEAAKAIAWTMRIFHGRGDISACTAGLNQAIALHPDGFDAVGQNTAQECPGCTVPSLEDSPVTRPRPGCRSSPPRCCSATGRSGPIRWRLNDFYYDFMAASLGAAGLRR